MARRPPFFFDSRIARAVHGALLAMACAAGGTAAQAQGADATA